MPMASASCVHDVSLGLGPGEVHCLVGPSGCGKTTILRLIAGLEPVQRGRIAIDGEVVAEPGYALPPEARRVGLMFQDFALFPHLRVLDNVAFGLRGLDAPRAPAAGRGAARPGRPRAPMPTATRTCSRAASSSAWRWPGRSRPKPRADAARRAVLEPRCDAARARARRRDRAAARAPARRS